MKRASVNVIYPFMPKTNQSVLDRCFFLLTFPLVLGSFLLFFCLFPADINGFSPKRECMKDAVRMLVGLVEEEGEGRCEEEEDGQGDSQRR